MERPAQKGDTVLVGVYQALSLRVLPPGSAPLGAIVAAGSTAPGQPEGRAWGQQLVVVDEVTAVDLVAHMSQETWSHVPATGVSS